MKSILSFPRMAFLLLSILTAPHTYGQDADKELTDLLELSLEDLLNVEVTTATKTASTIDLAPAIMEVITGDQIAQRGYTSLGQLVNDLAGNHQDRSNWGIGEPVNQNVGFGFRFDTGQNILILFNGQRLNAFLPGNRFGGEEYLLNNIERIEIIRGPGSSIYGTGAFTMVVNIISKKVTNEEDETIRIGSQYIPTSKGYLLNGNVASLVGSKGSLTGAFNYVTEEGQSLKVKNALFGNKTLKDGIDHAIDAEVVYRYEKFNLYSKFTNQKRNTFTGFNSVSPSDQDELKLSMYAYSIGSDYTFKLHEKANLKLSGGWHQDNWTEVALIPQFKLTPDGSDLLIDSNGYPILDTLSLYRNGATRSTSFFIDGQGADTRSLDGELQLTYNYSNSNYLIAGIYAADDKIINATRPSELNLNPLQFVPFRTIEDTNNNWLFDTNASRQTLAGYIQVEQKLARQLALTAGGRLDHYSGTGVLTVQNYTEFNPRGGLVYNTEKNGTFKALFGTATRIPNGFETLSSVAILGDPANRPERMRMIQLLWTRNWNTNFRTELGGFRAVISNRLVTDAAIPGSLKAQGFIGQFINTTSPENQENHGFEGKANIRINKANLMVNMTQYFLSNNGNGHPLEYIPTSMVNADLTLPVGWFSVSSGINYRNQFTKAQADPRSPVRSYLIGRLHIQMVPPEKPLKFSITARNLFNTKYAFPSSSLDFTEHFPARGFELMIGLSCRLN